MHLLIFEWIQNSTMHGYGTYKVKQNLFAPSKQSSYTGCSNFVPQNAYLSWPRPRGCNCFFPTAQLGGAVAVVKPMNSDAVSSLKWPCSEAPTDQCEDWKWVGTKVWPGPVSELTVTFLWITVHQISNWKIKSKFEYDLWHIIHDTEEIKIWPMSSEIIVWMDHDDSKKHLFSVYHYLEGTNFVLNIRQHK
jgi:hypothetical protein